VVGSVSRPDGRAHRMARHGAEPDTAQELTGAGTGPPRQSGRDRDGLGRENWGQRREPAGWLGASHGEMRRRARHGAGTHRRGAEVREDGPVRTGQVEIGVVSGRENRGRRREPAGSIPPKSMASSACRTSIWGPVVSGKRNVPASSRFAHTA
jgi:hypothetical protein